MKVIGNFPYIFIHDFKEKIDYPKWPKHTLMNNDLSMLEFTPDDYSIKVFLSKLFLRTCPLNIPL